MWKAWDDFGIAEARMVGYWEPDCPVHTDNPVSYTHLTLPTIYSV